jgi:hypothetical protein
MIADFEVLRVLLHLLFGEPALRGVIFGAGGDLAAHRFAFLLKEVFGDGPGRVEAALGTDVSLRGRERLAVGAGRDLDHRLLDDRIRLLRPGVRGGGTGQGGPRYLAGIERDAAHLRADPAAEQALRHLTGEELNGGLVVEQGNGHFGGLRAGDLAVMGVPIAEFLAAQGLLAALEPIGHDGAAAKDPRGCRDWVGRRRHAASFRKKKAPPWWRSLCGEMVTARAGGNRENAPPGLNRRSLPDERHDSSRALIRCGSCRRTGVERGVNRRSRNFWKAGDSRVRQTSIASGIESCCVRSTLMLSTWFVCGEGLPSLERK